MRRPQVSEELVRELGGSGEPVLWEEMTSPEIEELVRGVDAAIIPTGAVEQHGPHMPLCVDWNLSYHVGMGVSMATGVPILHPLPYGVSASHGDYPGTVSLRPETFMAVVEDMADWLYISGVRQLILLNGHAWNGAPLQVCAHNIRTSHDDMRVRALDYVDMYPPTEIDGRVEYGRLLAHANYFETSCMLHINPDLVHMDRAVARRDVDSFWDYRMDQVSESGVWGRDITEAAEENGSHEVARLIETMARAIAAGVAEPSPKPE